MTHTAPDKSPWSKLIWIAAAAVLADQITKAVVDHTIAAYQTIVVIPGFFNLIHIQNPGGAFGFLARQHPYLRVFFFLILSVLASGLVVYFYRQTPRNRPWLAVAFALIFGGAVGNLIDRFRLGKVIDFLDLYVGGWHWPAFNVADSCISIGMVIVLFHLLFRKWPQ